MADFVELAQRGAAPTRRGADATAFGENRAPLDLNGALFALADALRHSGTFLGPREVVRAVVTHRARSWQILLSMKCEP
jgi:hypothetical protein